MRQDKIYPFLDIVYYLLQRKPVSIESVDGLWPVELRHAGEDFLDIVEQVDPAVGVVVLLRLHRPQRSHALLREVDLFQHLVE